MFSRSLVNGGRSMAATRSVANSRLLFKSNISKYSTSASTKSKGSLIGRIVKYSFTVPLLLSLVLLDLLVTRFFKNPNQLTKSNKLHSSQMVKKENFGHFGFWLGFHFFVEKLGYHVV